MATRPALGVSEAETATDTDRPLHGETSSLPPWVVMAVIDAAGATLMARDDTNREGRCPEGPSEVARPPGYAHPVKRPDPLIVSWQSRQVRVRHKLLCQAAIATGSW